MYHHQCPLEVTQRKQSGRGRVATYTVSAPTCASPPLIAQCPGTDPRGTITRELRQPFADGMRIEPLVQHIPPPPDLPAQEAFAKT